MKAPAMCRGFFASKGVRTRWRRVFAALLGRFLPNLPRLARAGRGFFFHGRMFAVRALNDVTFGRRSQREQMNFAITSTATR